MDKFTAFMEKHFIPVASKVGSQRHLVAIRDAFLVSMPLMILGALAVMINNLPIPDFQNLMNAIFGGEAWKGFGGAVWNGTFAILSVFIAFLLAYNIAYSYKKDAVATGVVSLACFFTLGAAVSGMSSTGLFVALIVGIVSAEIFTRLIDNPKLVIKMPDGVPPAVAKAFASFYQLVQQPFMGLANSYGSALLIAFITPFLWFFGLHGANMIDPFMQTINALAIEANVKAIEAGKAAPYIVNKPFIDSFVNMGGTGVTLGLVIAIYLFGHKNKPYMVVNNLAAAPGIFIPFIITPMVCVTIAYFATKAGLVPAATVMPPWVTPPIIGGILATKSIAGGILAAVNLAVSTLIYAPFVIMATMQEQQKEQSAK
ncbi:PTS transporter subunit EIIC [Enterococcus cecorum]|uniref:PTS sugar transporter subunit IIC n=1 Tax=Enterococcus cecorum TaxID=44008 RepID=UPI001FAD88C9|nr:PTS transporter subunit EIIC [Enterococcus cecorum]MCJ0544050.1 PTS transporter subunit EIIC [Enterococcus cecorum]MCJ0548168.1 PTS transporter subunit EIIC [Enterococcus cecorum]